MTFDIDSFLDEPEEERTSIGAFDVDSFLDEPIAPSNKSDLKTFKERLGHHTQAVAGGLLQQGASSDDIAISALARMAAPDSKEDNFIQSTIKDALSTLSFIGAAPGWIKRTVMPEAYKDVDEAVRPLAEGLSKRGVEGLKSKAYTFEDNSLGYHAANIGESLYLMIPTLATGFMTGGSAAPSLLAMAPVVYGSQFSQSKADGRSDEQAAMDANFHALSEMVTEVGPFNMAFKAGQPAVSRIFKTAGMEGLSEVVNAGFQRAYEKGVVDNTTTTKELLELMTNDEALREYRDSLIAGAGLGAGMGVVGEAGQAYKRRLEQQAPPEETVETIMGAESIDEALDSFTASVEMEVTADPTLLTDALERQDIDIPVSERAVSAEMLPPDIAGPEIAPSIPTPPSMAVDETGAYISPEDQARVQRVREYNERMAAQAKQADQAIEESVRSEEIDAELQEELRKSYEADLAREAELRRLGEAGPELEGPMQAAFGRDVPRAPLETSLEEAPLTTREETEYAEQPVPLREPEKTWAEELPGMPQRVYAELEKVEPPQAGTTEEEQLQALRGRISETGETPEAAMRAMWGDEFGNAPPRLQEALRSSLAVQAVSPGITQEPTIDEAKRETAQAAEIAARGEEEAIQDRRAAKRSGEDRRQDIERRKRVAEMSDEEMRKELLTNELTGIPNRRAYEEAEKKPYTASIDIDSLKWVNDEMGHPAGDELLRKAAEGFAQTEDTFHVSGDEFIAQAATEEQLRERMSQVSEFLKNATITAELPDGTIIKKSGIEFSYGTGENINEAETRLKRDKAEREKAGLRAGRGREPVGVVKAPPPREQDRQREVATQETVRPTPEAKVETKPGRKVPLHRITVQYDLDGEIHTAKANSKAVNEVVSELKSRIEQVNQFITCLRS